VPETVQTNGVAEVKLTVAPEVVVADPSWNVPVPPEIQTWGPGATHEIACAACLIVIVVGVPIFCVYPALEGAVGVTVHAPDVSITALVPETVQTNGVAETKLTVVPAVSFATPSENVPVPPAIHVCVSGTAQLIV
jgi:hypothetical protein